VLLGQVAGEDEIDSSARDESLPDDQDLPVRLDEHDRGLAASGQVRDERSAGAEGRVEASAGIQPGDTERRAAVSRTQPGRDDLPVGLERERLDGIAGDRVVRAEVEGGLVKLGSAAPVGRYLTTLASMSWRLNPAPDEMARYLPSAWNTEEAPPRLDAIATGDGVTWACSTPAALNSAVDAPLSAKMSPAASSASAVIPPIELTATLPPLPKVVSRLPLAL
jgi:hypothetical protein